MLASSLSTGMRTPIMNEIFSAFHLNRSILDSVQ